jgi:hypothetical protein
MLTFSSWVNRHRRRCCCCAAVVARVDLQNYLYRGQLIRLLSRATFVQRDDGW